MRRLYRSKKDRKIAGVCGGVAEYFRIDSAFIRLGCIFLTLITGFLPGIMVYLMAWIVVPSK